MSVWSVFGWIAGAEAMGLALWAALRIIGRHFALDQPPDWQPMVRAERQKLRASRRG